MFREIIAGSMSFTDMLLYALSAFAVILLTMPVHEWAHGFIATKLGDPTPRYQGRLTLNPFAHIDYIGALCIILFGVGWAKPVQINPRNFRNPKVGMAITALAGPVSNILMAGLSLLLGNIVYVLLPTTFGLFVMSFFTLVASTNIYLAVFNLIPIPPFDGSRILFAILPDKYYWRVMEYERILMFVLLLIIATGILDGPLDFASDLIFGILDFITSLPFILFLR